MILASLRPSCGLTGAFYEGQNKQAARCSARLVIGYNHTTIVQPLARKTPILYDMNIARMAL
jgi:hypothetical protein